MAVRLSGLVSNLDTDAIVQELMSAQGLKKTKIENKITKSEWKQEKWKDLNTKIYALYTGTLSKMKYQSSYTTKKATASDESKMTVSASSKVPNGTHTVQVNQLASAQYYTGTKIALQNEEEKITDKTTLEEIGFSGGSITINTKDKETRIEIDSNTTVSDFITECKAAGINANFDTNQQRFFLSSKDSGEDNYFEIYTDETEENGQDAQLETLGLRAITRSEETGKISIGDSISGENSSSQFVQAQNSEIVYNGAAISSDSNNVTINGLTLGLTGTTTSAMTISVSNNTDEIYSMVKGFVSEYNTLLEEMNEAYSATSSKGYDPLTDDEKSAMSDDEIEKWESKIKDSLLRRDTTLSGIISTMKDSLSTSVEYDGKKYSLASFGIGTTGYTEKGLLHIDGDSEDSATASNEDKLKAALEDDPDAVMTVLSTLCGNLYTNLTDKMKATSLSSALTFYNDKQFSKELTQYKTDLSNMENKLSDLEDRYYSQFTAMESAMAKLNAQQSSLSSLIG